MLSIPALTPKDLEDLEFALAHADIVGLSFVRDASDVTLLLSELAARRAKELGLVAKVETAGTFERLPQVLLRLLAARRCGVMVARGDLAVELGFERLAEVQEEVLWLCQAPHVPVIWATEGEPFSS